MKKKGFTLIELIVVIAIIGVLAAILVPAMLGYIKKSKITSANSAAKSIYTASQSALTDLDAEDKWDLGTFATGVTSMKYSNKSCPSTKNVTGTTFTDTQSVYGYKIYTYFSDINKLRSVTISINHMNTEAVGVVDNAGYPGCTPKQFSVDDFDKQHTYTADEACYYGVNGVMPAAQNP